MPGDRPEQVETHHGHEAGHEKNRDQIPRRQKFHDTIGLIVPRPVAVQAAGREGIKTEQQVKRRRENRAEKDQGGQRAVVLREQTQHAGDQVIRGLRPEHIEGHDGENVGQNQADHTRQPDGQGMLPRGPDPRRSEQSTATRAAELLSTGELAVPVSRVAGVTLVPRVRKRNRPGGGSVGAHGH